jgi:hypothetical protein
MDDKGGATTRITDDLLEIIDSDVDDTLAATLLSSRVHRITLRCCYVSPSFAKTLNMRQDALSCLTFEDCDIPPRFFASLRINIDTLTIVDTSLAFALDSLTHSLKHFDYVRRLELIRNGLKGDGVAQIMAAFHECQRIESIRLRLNHIGMTGVNAVADLLHVNPNIKELCLSGAGLRDDEVEILADGIETQESVKRLDLSCNSIGERGAKALAALVEQVPLEELHLCSNGLKDEGACVLGGSLPSTTTLRVLRLGQNSIKDAGAAVLAWGLRENSSLQELDLAFNDIGHVGVELLARNIETNNCIQKIGVSDKYADCLGPLNYYLELNRLGRYDRIRSTELPAALWPHVLAKVSKKPSLLFFFVRARPEFLLRTPNG